MSKEKFYVQLQDDTLLESDKSRWCPCYWYPLKIIKSNIPALAFHADYFDDERPMHVLKEILREHGIREVIVIPELSDAYKAEDLYEEFWDEDGCGYELPYYSEQYIYDDNKDWMIYTSHEMTITLAGEWLVQEIKEKLLNYQEGLYGKNNRNQ